MLLASPHPSLQAITVLDKLTYAGTLTNLAGLPNDDYEFIAKNGGDIYNGVYDGKIIHSFLFFFKKDKFLEFSIFLENNKSNYGAIECDINDFLKISEKCKILPTEYYLGVKTNYYYEKNQYII